MTNSYVVIVCVVDPLISLRCWVGNPTYNLLKWEGLGIQENWDQVRKKVEIKLLVGGLWASAAGQTSPAAWTGQPL